MRSGKTPREIVDLMMAEDAMSQWLGIEIESVAPGKCTVAMTVTKDMVNGFRIAHGGITFSLADSAFAFASNSHGRKAMSIECSINHLSQVQIGDRLTARATESSLSHKLGVYHVEITDQDDKKVALFKGVVYRTSSEW